VEVLDLDGNSLRGQIPNSLVNASDLTVLTAMGNQLTGELAGEGTGDWLGARVHDRQLHHRRSLLTKVMARHTWCV
jgi:hypothetical protein